MLRSSNNQHIKFIARILVDVLILFLIYAFHWYVVVIALIFAAPLFNPYFEIIFLASILDAYYGSPFSYFYTTIAAVYFIIIHFLQDKILLRL